VLAKSRTSDVAGKAYSFTPMTLAPRDTTLTYSIAPGAASTGTYSNITISVTDGTTSASLSPFSIAVNQISNGIATVLDVQRGEQDDPVGRETQLAGNGHALPVPVTPTADSQ
jgi:hypothetical protein